MNLQKQVNFELFLAEKQLTLHYLSFFYITKKIKRKDATLLQNKNCQLT
jgi:hypothetical protein